MFTCFIALVRYSYLVMNCLLDILDTALCDQGWLVNTFIILKCCVSGKLSASLGN